MEPHATTLTRDVTYLHPEETQQHLLSWLWDGELKAQLECLHRPMPPEAAHCTEFSQMDYLDEFTGCYIGGDTPLRAGVITSGLCLVDGEELVVWSYDEPHPAAWENPRWSTPESPAPPQTFADLMAPRRGPQLHGVQLHLRDHYITPEYTCLHPGPGTERCDAHVLRDESIFPGLRRPGPYPLGPNIVGTEWVPWSTAEENGWDLDLEFPAA